MKGYWIFWRFFFCIHWDDHVALSLLLLICRIYLMICIYWTISTSLGWNQLNHGAWCFWYIVWYALSTLLRIFHYRDWTIILFVAVVVSLPSFKMSVILAHRMILVAFLPFLFHRKVWGVLVLVLL
jgi:hypothetical protein